MNHENWVICAISDADDPGEAILTGIRHRDFDGVILVPITDDGGWLYLDDSSDVAVRPLLLFYRGSEPELDEAIAWVKEHEEDAFCAPRESFPTTFADFGAAETIRSVTVSLNYPPFPWIQEARLGMEMGLHFDSVELLTWTDPTESESGVCQYRFYNDSTDGFGIRENNNSESCDKCGKNLNGHKNEDI